MGRHKLMNCDPTQQKETNCVHIKLDSESLAIWNAQKHRLNLSDWVRSQLKFHFSNALTSDQKQQLFREEIARINAWKLTEEQKVERIYQTELSRIQRKMSAGSVNVIITRDFIKDGETDDA